MVAGWCGAGWQHLVALLETMHDEPRGGGGGIRKMHLRPVRSARRRSVAGFLSSSSIGEARTKTAHLIVVSTSPVKRVGLEPSRRNQETWSVANLWRSTDGLSSQPCKQPFPSGVGVDQGEVSLSFAELGVRGSPNGRLGSDLLSLHPPH